MPLLDEFYALQFFELFLNLILSVVLTVLCLLSMLLIYSLLLISIETRTFELGGLLPFCFCVLVFWSPVPSSLFFIIFVGFC